MLCFRFLKFKLTVLQATASCSTGDFSAQLYPVRTLFIIYSNCPRWPFTLLEKKWVWVNVIVILYETIKFKQKNRLFLTRGIPVPYNHRRRIKTEEKAKVIADVWGTEFSQFLARKLFCIRMMNQNRKYFNPLVSDPGMFELWKKWRWKIPISY